MCSERYGIIGRPVGHSASPAYYNARFRADGIDAHYDFLELPAIEALEPLLPSLCGFNVTAPYKLEVMRYLDELSPEAEVIGAVNCVVRQGDKLVGYNTDYDGFRNSLLQFLPILNSQFSIFNSKSLILGTGGASRVVATVLKEMGIEYEIVSRTKGLTYDDLTPEMIASHLLLIDATPLGTFPDVKTASNIPYEALTPDHYLYDLTYNPPLTRFLRKGEQRGAHICNGKAMWQLQAERSYELYRQYLRSPI